MYKYSINVLNFFFFFNKRPLTLKTANVRRLFMETNGFNSRYELQSIFKLKKYNKQTQSI